MFYRSDMPDVGMAVPKNQDSMEPSPEPEQQEQEKLEKQPKRTPPPPPIRAKLPEDTGGKVVQVSI